MVHASILSSEKERLIGLSLERDAISLFYWQGLSFDNPLIGHFPCLESSDFWKVKPSRALEGARGKEGASSYKN